MSYISHINIPLKVRWNTWNAIYLKNYPHQSIIWRRHQMETFSASLAICVGNSPVTGEFPTQRPVTWRFDVFFNLCLNKRLSKQSWGWLFETPPYPLWRHCNGTGSTLGAACLHQAITRANVDYHQWDPVTYIRGMIVKATTLATSLMTKSSETTFPSQHIGILVESEIQQ